MTELEANFKLKLKEFDYFNNYSPECETTYCAVVKHSNDFSIIDDYYIEIGLTNFSVLTDPNYISDEYIIKKKVAHDFITKEFQEEYLKGNEVPVYSDKISLLGSSLKHDKITAGCSVFYKSSIIRNGTAGAFFKLKDSQDIYMISNRHVIVDSDFELGTEVVHPSRNDSSEALPSEIIGTIYWTSSPKDELLDAAVSKIHYPVDVGRYSLCRNIKFKSLGDAVINQNVSKVGRSTGLTHGEIRSINCTINVTEEIERPRFYRHQILSTNLAIRGDSGSVLVNSNEEVVGLIFASNKKAACFSNNIKYIFNEHNVHEFSKFV